MLAAMGWLLSACSATSSMNPVNWWHQAEGGKIAEQRPAPPGAEQAYPNLSTVPPKPAPADAKALQLLTDSLVADRTNAQHAAQSAPLADPSSPTASPGLFGVGTAPPPPPAGATGAPAGAANGAANGAAGGAPAASGSGGAGVASASLPAVTAPPSPPSPAPRKPVQSAPLQAPAATGSATDASAAAVLAGGAPAGGAATGSAAAGSAAAAGAAGGATSPAAGSPGAPPGSTIAGVSPGLPAGPPPRPTVAGAAPAMPVAAAPMPAASGGPAAQIVFLERAANLSAPASDEVKAFAAKRGGGTISVIGYGDSASSDPDAQSAALNLGLSRAQSIVDALKAAGVPGNAIRVSAEASGRGASLQVIR